MVQAHSRRDDAGGQGRPIVLVVACASETRRRLTDLLVPAVKVRELAPEDLREPARLVDAAAAVAVLEGNDAEAAIAPLLSLRQSPALILLAGDVEEAVVELAIDRLDPWTVLPDPPLQAALSLAVLRVLPGASGVRRSGQGARINHRPATALLGVSAALREVTEKINQFAPTRMPVLILGETGTGKELVARALHEQSERRTRAFVAINCSALPDTLLEGELFGYTRGAFTGADRDRRGLFEEADGGTLLLDEVGDTSPALQAKLLRVLEAQEIRPLGTNDTRSIDVRILSATHRDLESAAKEGDFRQDLFYRLNTATIFVPPLRRRPVDIPFLAQHFAEEFGEAHARSIVLDEGFLEALSRHDFPGNVRELRSAVERALALACPGEPVTADVLQQEGGSAGLVNLPRVGTLRARVEQVESEAIREALALHKGNRTRAAAALGLSRVGLRQKMRRLGLEAGPKR